MLLPEAGEGYKHASPEQLHVGEVLLKYIRVFNEEYIYIWQVQAFAEIHTCFQCRIHSERLYIDHLLEDVRIPVDISCLHACLLLNRYRFSTDILQGIILIFQVYLQ